MPFDPVLVTGAAGFIGYHYSLKLLEEGRRVVGIDNLNDYYDPSLKQARLERLGAFESFSFDQISVEDYASLNRVVDRAKPQVVMHMAAQAGVRYSLQNPHAYGQSNLVGFLNILEVCRHHDVQHLVYASSSSVYGANSKVPFSVGDSVDHPVSLYAATKKANELMAHTYSHLYHLPTTGLRFFTVYGPWGRPDMALFLFTKAILTGRPIDVFNYGQMKRDFTYVDDIVDGMHRLTDHPALPNPVWNSSSPDPATSNAPYRVYNIGNNRPVELLNMIEILEEALGKKAEKNMLPMQPGDVPSTFADIDAFRKEVGFEPKTPIEVGIPRFVEWYRVYYGV